MAPRALRHDNIYKEAQMSQVSKLVRLKTVIATNSSLFPSITVDAVLKKEVWFLSRSSRKEKHLHNLHTSMATSPQAPAPRGARSGARGSASAGNTLTSLTGMAARGAAAASCTRRRAWRAPRRRAAACAGSWRGHLGDPVALLLGPQRLRLPSPLLLPFSTGCNSQTHQHYLLYLMLP